MRTHTISIPRVPCSQNSDQWKGRWTRYHYKATWKLEAWVLLKEQLIMPMNAVRLSAVVYFPDRRRRDLDNYHASIFKAVQDALVAAGVIPDDDMRFIPEIPGLRFDHDKDNPRTVITLEEL